MSITPADNPPVVITPTASKNASWYDTSSIFARCNPVIAAIVGNSAIMIRVEITSFFAWVDSSALFTFTHRALTSFKWNSLNIFKPPAVENPHPPINIKIIKMV